MSDNIIRLPRPHSGQLQVLNSKSDRIVLMCGRQWGKSLVCRYISITRMLKGQRIGYLTPTYDLAKDFFRDIKRRLPENIILESNKSDLYIELINPSDPKEPWGSIKFISGNTEEDIENAFRGKGFHYVIVDEAAKIKDLKSTWEDVIEPTLSIERGGAIFISTPRGKEYFHGLYQKGLTGEGGYESFRFTSYDNPYQSEKWLNDKRSTNSQEKFNQEYLAIPGENSGNPFGTEHIDKNVIKTLSTKKPLVYGIDLAQNPDWTVIIGMDEKGEMCYFDRFQKPWHITIQEIQKLDPYILKVVDSTGVGAVVLSDLEHKVSNVTGFNFSSTSKPAIISELITDVVQGNIKYNQKTADEMHTYEFKYTASRNIKYEAISGNHDDCVAALSIANHHRKGMISLNEWKLYSA